MVASQTASSRYRFWMLALLLALYVTNFIDRTILSILQEPIRLELGLADWQLGILGGASFAIFYTVLGLPIAWLADRYSRTQIIVASAVALLSLMVNLIGLGLGPLAVGALSDVLARQVFSGGDFQIVCTAAPQAPACITASAEGLRLSILAAVLIFLWAAAHLALAARHIGRDTARGDMAQ